MLDTSSYKFDQPVPEDKTIDVIEDELDVIKDKGICKTKIKMSSFLSDNGEVEKRWNMLKNLPSISK